MLGWEFFVMRQEDARSRKPGDPDISLARWMAGLGGDQWLHDLIAQGKATNFEGNGYPKSSLVSAGALADVLGKGLPQHKGPLVIGDDYVMPGGWRGDAVIDLDRLRALDPHEILLVEAWDQS